MDDGIKPTDKSLVYVIFEVGSQDDQSREILHPLQQVTHLLVGIFVMGILYVGTFPEQGIGFIKEQNPILVFSFLKHLLEIFLGFTDVFGDYLGKVDSEYVLPELLPQ